MRQYVIINRQLTAVYIRPYTITKVLVNGDIKIYETDVDDVILESKDVFTVGETVKGQEKYSEVAWCRGMVEC